MRKQHQITLKAIDSAINNFNETAFARPAQFLNISEKDLPVFERLCNSLVGLTTSDDKFSSISTYRGLTVKRVSGCRGTDLSYVSAVNSRSGTITDIIIVREEVEVEETQAQQYLDRKHPVFETLLNKSLQFESLTLEQVQGILDIVVDIAKNAFEDGQKSIDNEFSFQDVQLIIDQFIVEQCPQYSQKGNGGQYLHKWMLDERRGIYKDMKKSKDYKCPYCKAITSQGENGSYRLSGSVDFIETPNPHYEWEEVHKCSQCEMQFIINNST